MLSRAIYRITQFRRSVRPQISESESQAARQTLGDSLFSLFESMHPADQRHALDVFELLLNQGHGEAPILQAALIHDCGKGAASGVKIGIWHRVAWVVLSPAPPMRAAAARVSSGLGALRDHGPTTLALARDYGADDSVVRLLEELEGLRPLGDSGRALKAADDAR